jgi:hypothetical protein
VPVRRAVAAAAVAVGLLASAASADGGVALDGSRHVKATFDGSVSNTAFSTETDRVRVDGDPRAPEPSDCVPGGCDTTRLRLTLPKGHRQGWFVVSVTAPRTLNLTIALLDAKGRTVQWTDPLDNGQAIGECCTTVPLAYTLTLTKKRMDPGTYSVVVYDRGGFGDFSGTVEFHALPRDRQTPAKK